MVVVGLSVMEVWPAVPTTSKGWALFVLIAPPAYVLVEGLSEWLWATRAGQAVSNHPSTSVRIAGGVLVFGALFALCVVVASLLGRRA